MAGPSHLTRPPQVPGAAVAYPSPYPPPASPSWPPAPAVKRRDPLALVVGVIAALALAASVAGAFVASDSVDAVDLTEAQARASANDEAGANHPTEWDERVEHLVSFVEEERGLAFEHPVQVDLLAPEAFADEVGEGYEELTDEEVQEIQDTLPLMRALGLMDGELDLLDTMTRFSQGAVAAFYDTEEKRIVAPTADPTAADEVVLVHELTHALQDQHFDLDSLLPDEADSEAPDDPSEESPSDTVIRALVEGDALRIEDAYFATLSPSEQESYDDTQGGEVGDVEAILEEVPSALIAMFVAPYALGPGLVDMLAAEGGNEAIDRAFGDPPTTTAQLVDPRLYLEGDDLSPIDPPAIPTGAGEPLEDGELGALDAYMMLAERLDPLEALSVIDHWGRDSYVVYEETDRVCLRIAVESPTAGGIDRLRSAFQQWAGSLSPAAEPEVEAGAYGGLLIQTCDPGPDAPLPNDRATDSLSLVGGRSDVASTLMDLWDVGADEAWPIADCYVRDVYELLDPGSQPDELDQDQLDDILRGCAA